MQQDKIIKIFLASSVTELKDGRHIISSLGDNIRNLFGLDNIKVQFINSEDIIAENLSQKAYQEIVQRELQTCDISLFIIKAKVNKWIVDEFDMARALEKEKRHRVFVYFLRVPEEKKTSGLKDFQHRLYKEGVYWKECESMSEVKFSFAMVILNYIGLTDNEETFAPSNVDQLEQYQKNNQQQAELRVKLHQNIDDILKQAKSIMENNNVNLSAKTVQVVDLFKKAVLMASKSDCDKKFFLDLLSKYARFLSDSGLYQDAETVYLRQIPIAEEFYGTEHENTATIYNNVGLVYDDQGNYSKALEYYSKALIIREKILGEGHPSIATSYNNIGAVYYSQGNYSQALVNYSKALAIQEKCLGIEHPGTTNSYNNIGSTYCSQGDYSKALEYYVKALAIQEKVLGINHPDTANSYNNIGMVYRYLGNYTKALKYYSKALAIQEKVLGIFHPNTANTYINIGMVYHYFGDYSEALECYSKALAIQEKVLGIFHPNTANTYNNIGAVYYMKENYEKALDYFNKALVISKIRSSQLSQDFRIDDDGIVSIRQKNKDQLDLGTQNIQQWLASDKSVLHPLQKNAV